MKPVCLPMLAAELGMAFFIHIRQKAPIRRSGVRSVT